MSPAWINRVVKRIEGQAGWSDLQLSDESVGALKRLVQAVQSPGEGRKVRTGACAMLVGGSEEPKVTAAQAVSADLQLDLYRVDLAMLKGDKVEETERALRRVLDAAESSRGALFFAEGDCLFDKGTEEDSYPEKGGSYLVKQIGRYEGVSFLSVTSQDAVDLALQRKLKPVIDCGG